MWFFLFFKLQLAFLTNENLIDNYLPGKKARI